MSNCYNGYMVNNNNRMMNPILSSKHNASMWTYHMIIIFRYRIFDYPDGNGDDISPVGTIKETEMIYDFCWEGQSSRFAFYFSHTAVYINPNSIVHWKKIITERSKYFHCLSYMIKSIKNTTNFFPKTFRILLRTYQVKVGSGLWSGLSERGFRIQFRWRKKFRSSQVD